VNNYPFDNDFDEVVDPNDDSIGPNLLSQSPTRESNDMYASSQHSYSHHTYDDDENEPRSKRSRKALFSHLRQSLDSP